jgi:hypothetical protein
MEQSKNVFLSKTVWFNVLSAIVLLSDELKVLSFIPAETLLTINIVVNILIRVFFTNEPVKFKTTAK